MVLSAVIGFQVIRGVCMWVYDIIWDLVPPPWASVAYIMPSSGLWGPAAVGEGPCCRCLPSLESTQQVALQRVSGAGQPCLLFPPSRSIGDTA